MVWTLAGEDFTKMEYIRKNCDIIDYIIHTNFKKYNGYLEIEATKRIK